MKNPRTDYEKDFSADLSDLSTKLCTEHTTGQVGNVNLMSDNLNKGF